MFVCKLDDKWVKAFMYNSFFKDFIKKNQVVI